MKRRGKTKFPQKGDKVWRERTEDEVRDDKGANGKIVRIDFTAEPTEYLVLYPAARSDQGVVSRESYCRDDLTWTDRFGGTWFAGELPTVPEPVGSTDVEY